MPKPEIARRHSPQWHSVGCILGTAIGDAIGLPYEGLSRRRASRLLGAAQRHRFLFGWGMVSDDTEHTCMTAQSLIAARGDLEVFRQVLASRLRWWLLGLPAGIGLATLRSVCRLWIGIPPERSGVFSAGNGPAMRAAILGAAIEDRSTLLEFVRASTRMTHSDPKAEYGAFAVALAARMACESEEISGEEYLRQLRESLDAEAGELFARIDDAVTAAKQGMSTNQFADSLGLSRGVTGYIYHTVPVAIHAWLRSPHDYRSAVSAVVECGGDADSTAAIVGGIIGAGVGRAGIPAEWIDRLFEWPRTVSWMEHLGGDLGTAIESGWSGSPQSPSTNGLLQCTKAIGVVIRNLFFLLVVFAHGFRRLAPPY